LGCANDENIRYNATSGGIARTIIYTALKKQACSRVYTVCESNVYPWAMGAYLTIESDKANIANSIYRPLPVCENLIKITEGKLLVIGTSCQLLAMESFYASSQVQLIKVCIFCKQQKTLDFTRYLAKYLYISDYRNTPIKYRGSGWPGVITFGKQKVSFEKFASLPFGKRLWCIPACHYCTNPMGVKADLTLADPWGIIGKEQSGMTMVIIRTDEGEKLINMCKDQMQLREISLDLVKKSVDWIGIKRKQARTDYKRRKQKGTIRHILNTLGDVQRDIYEKLLLSIRLPKIVLKALNKLPYWG
jgi:coenzyme F420-reducing hydrogenase beta subunit